MFNKLNVGVITVFVVLAVFSFLGVSLPPPAPWLDGWTKWVASVVAIAAALRLAWVLPELLQGLVDRR